MTIPPEVEAVLWSLVGLVASAIKRWINRRLFWRKVQTDARAELQSPEPGTASVPVEAVTNAIVRAQRRQIRDTVKQIEGE